MVSSKGELLKLAGTNFDLLQLLELKEEEFERANKVRLELEKELSAIRSRFQAELKHVQDQLAWSKAELANSKQAFEKKDNELHRLSEQLHLAKLQHCQYEESVCNLQGEVMFLGLKLQNLEADSKKSNRQLKNQYFKSMEEWMAEKVSLMLQITNLEGQSQQVRPPICDGQKPESTASRRCSDSLSCDMSHSEEAYAPLWFDSSSSHGSIQSLVELGEAFHAGDEELQHLRTKLNDAATRESHIVLQLQNQAEKFTQLEAEIGHVKEELRAEKEKAREESEDMAQEMAELRYQFMEMLEVERDLRARTEQASVHRVEELEAQVDRARQQLVAALARRREAEQRSENLEVRIQHLNAALEIEHHQKQEYIEIAQRDKELLQLRLLELQENFCQLEKEKKLLETRFSENVETCKPCTLQCALRMDAKKIVPSTIEDAKPAELDNRLQALSCQSDLLDDGRQRGTMVGAQVILDCKCFHGDGLCSVVNSEARYAQSQKLLVEKGNEVEKAIQYGLKVDIELLVLSGSFELEIKRLRNELVESEKETVKSKQIQEEKELEMQQVWKQLELFKVDFSQYQESVANLEDEIVFLREELSSSDADWEKSYDQLNQKHAERVNEWTNEKICLLIKTANSKERLQQVLHIGDNALHISAALQTNSGEDTEVLQAITSFNEEIAPSDHGNMLQDEEGSFQDLVALGEASLAGPEGGEHFDGFEIIDTEAIL